jgi:hypothetical protein
MKNHGLTFSAFLLLGIALYGSPSSAFVTTDVAEGAGRVVATVGDVVRAGGVELEKLEHKIFGERIQGPDGEGNEIDSYIPKIKGWATKYAKDRLKAGDPNKKTIRDNAALLAQTEAEIAELKVKKTLARKEAEAYYNIIEKNYQEKLASYEANKEALLAMQKEQMSKLNLTEIAQQKLEEFKAKAQAEMEAKLGEEMAAVQSAVNTVTGSYQSAKTAVENQYKKDQAALDADLKDITNRRDALEAEIKELTESLEKEKELHQDTMAIEMKISAAQAERDQLNQQINVEIPAKYDTLEKEATSKANDLLADFEKAKQEKVSEYAAKQAELEIAYEDKVNEFMEELKSQDINVEGLLNGSTVNNAVDNTVKDMEDEIKIAASELLEYKSSFEDKLKNRIRDIEAQIQDKEDTVKRLKDQLAKQLVIGGWEALGVKFDEPDTALKAAMSKNYIDPNKPETAENVDEIRRNRFIERRDAYMSSYADAVMIKNRIVPDLAILENFAQNTDSMDTLDGVINADTNIKIKTIEALMQYAEILVAQLRMDTATEFGKLLSYKVKNPDKEITNFNLDDYIYNCTIEQGE